MTIFEIPLTPNPQTFTITLSGVAYELTVQWNVWSNSWVLDIADGVGNPILQGIALVTGVDLLEQYAYLNFGGQLYCKSDGNTDDVPTFSNLGQTSHVFWVTNP